MRRQSVHEYSDGPAVEDSEAVRAWLKENEGNRLRLPVTVGEHSKTIGPSVAVNIDDCQMGVGFGDHTSRRLSQDDSIRTFWIEGFLRQEPDTPPNVFRLVMRKFGGQAAAGPGLCVGLAIGKKLE